jgi:hypothetical protein
VHFPLGLETTVCAHLFRFCDNFTSALANEILSIWDFESDCPSTKCRTAKHRRHMFLCLLQVWACYTAARALVSHNSRSTCWFRFECTWCAKRTTSHKDN